MTDLPENFNINDYAHKSEKLIDYNSGVLSAYAQVISSLKVLDPAGTCEDFKVLEKYLLAWIASTQLKLKRVGDFQEDINVLKQENTKDKTDEFLELFDVNPEECEYYLKVDDTTKAKIKEKCKEIILSYLNGEYDE